MPPKVSDYTLHAPLLVSIDVIGFYEWKEYRLVPAHRNWHIGTAGWNWASFLH